MTKKDYELIAQALRTIEDELLRHTATSAIADRLKDANPNFDEMRFRLACNNTPEGVQRAVRKIVAASTLTRPSVRQNAK